MFLRTVWYSMGVAGEKIELYEFLCLAPRAARKKITPFFSCSLVWEFLQLVLDTSTHHPLCLENYCVIGQKFGNEQKSSTVVFYGGAKIEQH